MTEARQWSAVIDAQAKLIKKSLARQIAPTGDDAI
jgi:hypothetical protein